MDSFLAFNFNIDVLLIQQKPKYKLADLLLNMAFDRSTRNTNKY